MFKILFFLVFFSSSLISKEIKISALNKRNHSVNLDSLIIYNYNLKTKYKITDSLVDFDIINSVDSKVADNYNRNDIICKLNNNYMSIIFNNFSSDLINIKICNILGKLIYSNNYQIINGFGNINIDLTNNYENFYIIHFTSNNFDKTIKVMGQNIKNQIRVAKPDILSNIDIYKIIAYSKGYKPSIIDSVLNVNEDLTFLMLDDFSYIAKSKSVFKEITIDSAIQFSSYRYHSSGFDDYYTTHLDTLIYTMNFDDYYSISKTLVINDTFKIINFNNNFLIEFKPDYLNSKLDYFRLYVNIDYGVPYQIVKRAEINLENVSYQVEVNKIVLTANFSDLNLNKNILYFEKKYIKSPAANIETTTESCSGLYDSDGKGTVKITLEFKE
jgi:hypothetical protein